MSLMSSIRCVWTAQKFAFLIHRIFRSVASKSGDQVIKLGFSKIEERVGCRKAFLKLNQIESVSRMKIEYETK